MGEIIKRRMMNEIYIKLMDKVDSYANGEKITPTMKREYEVKERLANYCVKHNNFDVFENIGGEDEARKIVEKARDYRDKYDKAILVIGYIRLKMKSMGIDELISLRSNVEKMNLSEIISEYEKMGENNAS